MPTSWDGGERQVEAWSKKDGTAEGGSKTESADVSRPLPEDRHCKSSKQLAEEQGFPSHLAGLEFLIHLLRARTIVPKARLLLYNSHSLIRDRISLT